MPPVDLTSFDAVLLDLDGTIWHEEVALPGAIELIRALQERKQPYAFVSNSGLSPARLVERLGRIGAVVGAEYIDVAAAATCGSPRLRGWFASRPFIALRRHGLKNEQVRAVSTAFDGLLCLRTSWMSDS